MTDALAAVTNESQGTCPQDLGTDLAHSNLQQSNKPKSFNLVPMVRSPKKRQSHPKPAPYKRKPKTPHQKDGPATSTKHSDTSERKNLTLNDWLMVFAYINEHPDLPQDRIVQHFKTRKEGVLEFTQATLSRKLKDRTHLEQCIESYPSALSSKRPLVVTRPDVEEALKGESYTGAMLWEKRRKLEEKFGVPETERLIGDGWIAPFCKAYNIKEYRRHGEARSVDIEAVKHEWLQVGRLLSTFPVRDHWNFDESSLFAMAPPDRGLATHQMSGKKKEKFRVILGFATNADGSKKLPLFFIG
ncbi:hypothetical protein DFJ58DRAFT_838488 [Suillus subalutaceus]|uniref:uncharacterized protein n=1 Tax=Suillus subalutaceus TaxID=48586 RepID=UPI001B88153A|nr:uncharacterized protein DFJ58DRAFT_838488 [Suillus subalutaceus]KAG1865845.1 hypothetical protein DFJ58DRAFT_838488 [Suillus subalutaceus]